MAQTFSTNANNDIFIAPNGNIAISQGQDAVLQACATAAKAQLGEMVLAQNNGIPNFETVWTGSPNIAAFEAALRKTLNAVSGVVSVTNLSVSAANNILSYRATIESVYGATFLNG